MTLKQLAVKELGLTSLEEANTRLDINTVITRIYDEQGFPILLIKGITYSFSRFTMTKVGKVLEVKYYQ